MDAIFETPGFDYDGVSTLEVGTRWWDLTFDWRICFGMESLWEGNYGDGSIAQVTYVGDTSDAITAR